MEELLQTIVEQNERIVAVLENLEGHISEIKFAISYVHDELQWQEDLSAAAQIIKAVEGVTDVIREQS